jgi:hypothetical protein
LSVSIGLSLLVSGAPCAGKWLFPDRRQRNGQRDAEFVHVCVPFVKFPRLLWRTLITDNHNAAAAGAVRHRTRASATASPVCDGAYSRFNNNIVSICPAINPYSSRRGRRASAPTAISHRNTAVIICYADTAVSSICFPKLPNASRAATTSCPACPSYAAAGILRSIRSLAV